MALLVVFSGLSCWGLIVRADQQWRRQLLRHWQDAAEGVRLDQVRALYTLTRQLSLSAYQNLQQARFITEQKTQQEKISFLAHHDQLTGLEALIRWRHLEKGLLPPGQFIPVAEDSRLIAALGRWILDPACVHMADRQSRGNARCAGSVNVSARPLFDSEFAGFVEKALAKWKLPPRQLEMEVTENFFLGSNEVVEEVINRLKDIGGGLTLDNFGTGYSSFSYLKRFRTESIAPLWIMPVLIFRTPCWSKPLSTWPAICGYRWSRKGWRLPASGIFWSTKAANWPRGFSSASPCPWIPPRSCSKDPQMSVSGSRKPLREEERRILRGRHAGGRTQPGGELLQKKGLAVQVQAVSMC